MGDIRLSQSDYQKIPSYPASYTAGNVLARIIDSLGFRYYWTTEGLTDADLDYRPSDGGKNTRETLDHIYYLTTIIAKAFEGSVYELPEKDTGMSFGELRKETLAIIKQISDQLKSTKEDAFEGLFVRFRMEDNDLEFPFWNAINGPMADSLYHVGQIASFRRAAGNPVDPKVQVFFGKLMEA
jgi:hypothetical protein